MLVAEHKLKRYIELHRSDMFTYRSDGALKNNNNYFLLTSRLSEAIEIKLL